MLNVLTGFVGELRQAGLPVSMVEAIDAANALKLIDIGDREAFKHTLGATLVKHARHYSAFETAFEVYFGLRPHTGQAPFPLLAGGGGGSGAGAGGEGDAEALVEALFRAVKDEDTPLLRAVVLASVERLAGMEPGRPVGGTYYLYRALRHLDLEALADRLFEAMGGPGLGQLEQRLLREEIELRLEQFRMELRAEIRRRLVDDRGVEAVAKTLRRPLVEDIDLMHAGRAELAEIERAVHPLTRKLATRMAQRRKQSRDGRLDVRSTIRRSLSVGGALIDPRFRSRRPSRPELVILSDISGSVATFARFTLQLVYALGHEFTRVRSFAFIDAIDEVSDYFGGGTEFGTALARISTEAEVVWLDGHSDYGNAFEQFTHRYMNAVSPRSVVLVTGDARSNYHDPNLAAFGEIVHAARSTYWLNPEARRYWDTGDSIMGAYAPLCDGVHEVRNLRQIEAFVESISLPAAAGRISA